MGVQYGGSVARVSLATWHGLSPEQLSDAQLCLAWRASFTALQRVRRAVDRLVITEYRAGCLDEFARRDPVGFEHWLARGARAAIDAGGYPSPVSIPPNLVAQADPASPTYDDGAFASAGRCLGARQHRSSEGCSHEPQTADLCWDTPMNEHQEQLAQVQVQALVAREPAGVDDEPGTVGWLQRVCRAAVRALPASGAGISVMTDEGVQGTAAASDATSERIEELQFTLGEGPCLDAYAARRPVLTSDLTDRGMTRWPGYAPAAHDIGVRAVFAFPLQVGAARLGVLDIYREQPGALSVQALAQALTFADVVMTVLFDGQQPMGGSDTAGGLEEVLDNHLGLYQAQGMVAVQLGVDMADAMARLRAHAYAHSRRLQEVARDVVGRRLRLDRDDE